VTGKLQYILGFISVLLAIAVSFMSLNSSLNKINGWVLDDFISIHCNGTIFSTTSSPATMTKSASHLMALGAI
jgi:hypothetical protein